MNSEGDTPMDPGVREVLAQAVRHIVERYQPEKIVLFGSYAYGRPDAESDLDLLIIKQSSKRPIDRRIEVRMLLWPLRLRPVISPIVVTQAELDRRLALGDQFAQEMVTRGRVLYEHN